MATTLSRPPLVVRVGITGHRQLGDDPQVHQALSDALNQVFGMLHAQVDSIYRTDQQNSDLSLYEAQPPTIRLISGLAAGADQLAAFKALEQGWQLEAVLPFTVEEFGKDFGTTTEPTRFGEKLGLPWSDDLAAFQALLEKAQPACIELCGPTEPEELRNRSYLAVGQGIVRRCEVLVAVWDGREAAGRGGSADVVEYALRSGTPVIWIDSHAPEKVYWLRIIDDYYQVLQHRQVETTLTAGQLEHWLGRLLLPALAGLQPDERTKVGKALQRFREDLHAEPEVGKVQDAGLSIGLITGFFTGLFVWVRNRLSKIRVEEKQYTRTPTEVEKYFLNNFNHIDQRANYMANCYRSTYTGIIGLGALAILLAIFGVAYFRPAIVGTEIIVLVAICLLIYNEKRAAYHRRWVDGRTFAELLRITRWMALLGRELPVEVNAGTGSESNHKSTILSENLLLKHYFNAIVRAAPLKALRFDPEFLRAVNSDIRNDLLDEQIAYHHVNARRSHQISHRLESFAYITLGLTIIVVVIEIILAIVMAGPDHPHGFHVPLLGILAGMLPTIAAATAAFRHQSEFELLAIRSKLMANNLKLIKEKLEKSRPERPWATELLAEQLITTAELMVADVTDWSLVFQVKAVEPA